MHCLYFRKPPLTVRIPFFIFFLLSMTFQMYLNLIISSHVSSKFCFLKYQDRHLKGQWTTFMNCHKLFIQRNLCLEKITFLILAKLWNLHICQNWTGHTKNICPQVKKKALERFGWWTSAQCWENQQLLNTSTFKGESSFMGKRS